MKNIAHGIYFFLFILFSSFSAATIADDATTELFRLLDRGGCIPSSLTGSAWTISTSPVGTHGELNWGDELVFEQLNAATSLSRKSKFNVWKNGVLWESANGWSGSCVRDGILSLYVVTGEINLDGCLHELAIGRLDHDDSLAHKIEVVFQDSAAEKAGECEGFTILHPGHAHGVK
jgi:hypothetical protein